MKTLRTLVTALVMTLAVGGSACLTDAQLLRLRMCESTDNYQAVSASGKFRGAYQFTFRTWAGVGGKGDPAAASPAEQDLRARILYERDGRSPWPVCGRRL